MGELELRCRPMREVGFRDKVAINCIGIVALASQP